MGFLFWETNSIPDSVQFQLYANGQPVDEQEMQ